MVEQFGMSQETFTPDKLIGGNTALVVSRSITLLSGENRTRGALLGKITKTAPTTGTAGSNTGNGTCTGVAMGKKAQIGTYVLTCIVTATNGGTFSVIAPDGSGLKNAVVGTPYVTDHINFTINDGTTDFALGDSFTIAVAAGSGKYKLSLAAAVDGSQDPDAVLAKDTDATSEDRVATTYVGGIYNESAITFGAGHTADSVREVLRSKGIHLVKGVAG